MGVLIPIERLRKKGESMTNEKAIRIFKELDVCDADWEEMREALDLAIAALERDTPKRVGMSEWKGYRNTRYKCPGCGKNARNDETYCHKCGQHIVFPMIDFTPYAEGKKQKVVVTWPDEVFFEVPLPEPTKEQGLEL